MSSMHPRDGPLSTETRSAALRRRHRRTLWWSVAAAAALHLAVFAAFPDVMPPLWDTAGPLSEVDAGDELGARWIDITFGPPAIRLPDGTTRQEPPGRVLVGQEVDVRGIPLEGACRWVHDQGLGPVSAEVRLRLGASGRVLQAALHETSGDECADDVLVAVAGMLLYHWLPDDDAPAPVDLVQPVAAVPAPARGLN
jgi:hypothetical protein